MKRFAILLIIVSLVSCFSFASPGYDPGIKGDEGTTKNVFKYKETVFLSGEPIVLEGTIKVTEDPKGTKTTLEYKLNNTAKSAVLNRKVVFLNTSTKDESGRQTTYSTTVDPKFTETVTIGSTTYTLVDYQFNRSGILDEKGVIKYLVSNWEGTKTYNQGSDGSQVIVGIDADLYRYDCYWSATETSLVRETLTYRYKDTDNTLKDAVGTVDFATSNTLSRNLSYINNEPVYISFKGGYIMKENQENVVKYIYDVPVFSSGKPTGARKTGSDSYKMVPAPKQKRLFVPTIRDVVSSYWASEDIRILSSLDAFDIKDNYFQPLNFMSRGEFARLIDKAANITVPARGKTYEQIFEDVPQNHPYADYINAGVKAGAIYGVGGSRYQPDTYLSKAEAATILVRALGVEDASTESSYSTSFADDAQIPYWAKKPVNIARKMGLISGNQSNRLEPNKVLTRAEAAAMMNRFIKYLQYDIKKEYREKIINFGH